MNEEQKPENTHAFPSTVPSVAFGITLRDYFANSAMQSHITMFSGHIGKHDIAKISYEIADAMLKQR